MSEHDAVAPSGLVRGINWLILALLILPMTIVIPVSLTDQPYLSLPKHKLSLRHYVRLLTSADWLSSFAQSFTIGAASTAIAVTAGALATIGCWQIGRRWSAPFRVMLLVPLIVPSVVYALGIYRLFIPLHLLDTYLGVILAHAVTAIPYVVITISAALAGFDPALLRAARGLGASQAQALRHVLLPAIAPGLISGAILAFMHSWDEIVIVLFVASRSIVTVPRRIWDGINEQLDPAIAAVATVMVVVSILLLAVNRYAAPASRRPARADQE